MKYTARRASFWLLVYIFLALLPMIIALTGGVPPRRDFWMELGVGLGFIGLGMLGLQFIFSGRFRRIAPTYGMDNILQYHREMGIIAFLFILAHPIIIILHDPEFLSYFDPGVNAPRAISLGLVSLGIILITTSSLWRLSFGLSYEWWRLIHGVLSMGIILVAIAHPIQVGHYFNALWQKLSIAVLLGLTGYLIIHTRLVRPWKSRKRQYRIVEVIRERGEANTIRMEPDGHDGLNFVCGQFVWITIGNTPFSMQQHPFTIASAAKQKTLSFTAKGLGDFSSSWKDIPIGTKAFLEGPFGSFTPEKDKNLFLIMGGIGVTPGMSMLRSLKQNNDKREVVLVYGNPDWEDVTFRDELDMLKNDLNMKLVHVLENPHEGWEGETGFVDLELLEKYLPENPDEFMYFICGPTPLMDVAEVSLRKIGIDWRLIYTERFEII